MDLLLCELKLGASARVVLQDDGDSRGLVDYEPGWVNGAGDHDVVVVAPGAQVGQQRQRRQEYSDPGDVGEPEQQTADEQRQAGCQECTAAGGEYAPDSVALAWMLAASDVVVPIPGASRPKSAVASAAASELLLPPEQLARLNAS